ncbi:MAG: CRISPR-associated protein Csx15 [Anaerolineae bacterium]
MRALVLNFSHPMTPEQVAQLAALMGVGEGELEVRRVPAQFDLDAPLHPQVVALADACGLSPEEWQLVPLVVVPPSLSVAAVVLLAELHGRAGYFVPVVRLKQEQGSVPPRFSVAEVLDLQHVRVQARMKRG